MEIYKIDRIQKVTADSVCYTLLFNNSEIVFTLFSSTNVSIGL